MAHAKGVTGHPQKKKAERPRAYELILSLARSRGMSTDTHIRSPDIKKASWYPRLVNYVNYSFL